MNTTSADLFHCGSALRALNPLIHCITSPIAINDCANVLLALGARPIMCEHPSEVAGITRIAASLSVGLANITDARLKSIMISGVEAYKEGKRSCIDCVGVNCSPIRMDLAKRYIAECRPAVIKGNASEIRAVAGAAFGEAGIDTAVSDRVSRDNPGSIEAMAKVVKDFSRKSGAVVLASGVIDMISDGNAVWAVENGSPRMSLVTGTGCILSCMTAAFLSVADTPADAVLYATALLGIAGEISEEACQKASDSFLGLGSFHVGLINALSLIDDDQFQKMARITKL
ncbi:MAG: hydroxyethylthiazole kinase [Lachnospiraceae bacterium]|nr:hydroxyethylthiazole kinase [Lachnospiraceae bacterium]